MTPLTHRDQPFRAPADPDDTEEYRRILEDLRAMDAANDDEPDPRQARSKSPRHRVWQDAWAPLMDWKRLLEATESNPVGSNWMAAQGDPDGPTDAEPGKQNLFSEEQLILAASLGVRWHQVGGRLVPADGQLEYSKSTGRLIRCGALILADAIGPANDDEPQPKDDADRVEIIGGIRRPTAPDEDEDEDSEGDLVDEFDEAINPDVDRGRRNGDDVRAGEIVGVLHKTRHEGVKLRKAPRHPEGRFRKRKGKRPPSSYIISPDDRIDSQVLIRRLLPYMSADAVRVLDYALRAANLAEIGEVFGKSGKHAERVGRQKLTDACAEFEIAIKKIEGFDNIRQQSLAA
ncbi:MAG: hypothetical protein J0J10_09495 [Bosea sp.]|uniref:hypothetical protein n=1 Tax=Bosea sp. (in: a-proteobacteria) TaxID=1871050 RepID=UPI001AD1128B|nr:hypothetical protein [Bosea sp. (in: a-proteobacteria)]MBN9468992.1 hypothetical protein [Bosea sp. (in: a-proteobacteria)]